MLIVGRAVAGPLDRGGEQRLLQGVLALAEVAVPAGERGEDARRLLGEKRFEAPVAGHISGTSCVISGRSSTPIVRASGQRAARRLGADWPTRLPQRETVTA